MEEVTPEQLSPEALDEQRSKLMEYYEKTNPFLKAQAEYESLITDIQESKTVRRAQIQERNDPNNVIETIVAQGTSESKGQIPGQEEEEAGQQASAI